MEDLFNRFADYAALILEALTVVIILTGGIQAVFLVLRPCLRWLDTKQAERAAWMGFARWLIFALELTLAADIIRTTISPTWDQIGQLASIAAIRTFLGFFLERDLREFSKRNGKERILQKT